MLENTNMLIGVLILVIGIAIFWAEARVKFQETIGICLGVFGLCLAFKVFPLENLGGGLVASIAAGIIVGLMHEATQRSRNFDFYKSDYIGQEFIADYRISSSYGAITIENTVQKARTLEGEIICVGDRFRIVGLGIGFYKVAPVN